MFENGQMRQSANFDPELALARLLSGAESINSVFVLDDKKSSEFSSEQLEQLRQAQECLELLNKTNFSGEISATSAQTEKLLQGLATFRDCEASKKTCEDSFFKLPETIGRFRIIEEIGKGGFGIVLKAHDPSLERFVALKIPRAETLVSEELQKRFDREARAAGTLSHPAIVPIYESGKIGPAVYIAFAYCDGISLDVWMKQTNTLPPILAAKMIARLADALSHAHSRGVVHRDIKPGNIMVTSKAECNEAELVASLKITDFGLAVLAADDESLTIDGALVGTPAYMSPEQAGGDSDGGPAVDIYSLGVVLYQLLTGKVPFSGKSNLAILKAITEDQAQSPKSVNVAVPSDLATICLKCLEKRPAARYESASDLSDDLQRFLQQRPIRAKQLSAWRSFQLWCKRNPLAAVLSLLLFVSLIGGFLGTRLQYNEAQTNLEFAETNFQQAKRTVDDLLTKAMSTELKTQPTVRKEMLLTVSNFYHQFIAQKHDDPDLNYDLAVANSNLGKIDRELGKYSEALERFNVASELFELSTNGQSNVSRQLEKLENLTDIGLQYDLLGQLIESKVAYELAIKAGKALGEQFPGVVSVKLGYARAIKNLGAVLRQLDDMENSKRLFDLAHSIRTEVVHNSPDQSEYRYRLAMSHSSLADWYITNGDMDDALHHAKQQLSIVEYLAKEDPANLGYVVRLPSAMNRISDVLRKFRLREDWQVETMAWLGKAEVLQRELLASHPLYADVRNGLANTLINQGDVARHTTNPELAVNKYNESLKIIDQGLRYSGNANFKARKSKAGVLRRIGTQYERLGAIEKALQCYSVGILECKELLANGDNYPARKELRSLLFRRGVLLFSQQSLDDAENDFVEYLAVGGERWEVRSLLARVALWGGGKKLNSKETLAITRELIEQQPANDIGLVLHAAALLADDQPKLAIEFCRQASESNNGKQAGRFICSIAYSKLKDVISAKREAETGKRFFETPEESDIFNLTSRELVLIRKQAEQFFLN